MKVFRRVEARIVFLAVFIAAAGGALAERPVDERPFHALDGPLAPGASVTLAPVTLDDGTDVVLELARVEPFTKDAQIVVHEPDGDTLAPLPSDAWFTGRVAGDPESFVMMARGRGLRGLIVTGDRAAVIGPHGDAYAERPSQPFVRSFSPDDDAPDTMRNFTCGTEALPTPQGLFSASHASGRRALTTVMYFAAVAIETDYELYVKKGSSVPALTQYVGDLFAAISAVYQRDVQVTLQVNYLSVWTTASDPWVTTASDTALYEFGDYWHANHAGLARTTAHFLSGRNTGGGIAWIGTICRSDFPYNSDWGGGYGFTGSLSGTSPTNISTTYWDFMAVTHEIGHNFGSPHTHCYGFGSYATWNGSTLLPIDQCYSGETGCYSGSTSVPAVKGTVMSYCHLLSGGYSNIKMYLAVPGEPSQEVRTVMRSYIEGASCLGAASTGMNVTGISPPTGSIGGGTPVTISGTGFVSPVTVKFRGILATSVVVANATTVTAVTPAGTAGTADVWVVQGAQGSMLAGGYTYTSTPPPPTVSTISPAFGPTAGGTAVTITGASFVSGATVSIGGTAATWVSFVSSTTLTATTGAHAAGTVNVVVTNPDLQTGTLASSFAYGALTPPTKFYAITPCRVLDTRNATGPLGGPALAGGGAQRTFTVTGTCGIPSSAKSISLNLTVTQAAAAGSLTAYAGNGIPNGTSSVSFAAGMTRANNAVICLATDGTGSIGVENDSAGTVQFILDVNGYFQ
jgi:hypothetical protein